MNINLQTFSSKNESNHLKKNDDKTNIKLQTILSQNKIDDLKKFIAKRDCLNITNQIFHYLFHIIQLAGLLTTSIATQYDIIYLIWIGIGLNGFASLIIIFSRTHEDMSKILLKDIQDIESGNYIDESMLVNVTNDRK